MVREFQFATLTLSLYNGTINNPYRFLISLLMQLKFKKEKFVVEKLVFTLDSHLFMYGFNGRVLKWGIMTQMSD